MKNWIGRLLGFVLIAGLIAAALYFSLREQPVLVDTARVFEAPMSVEITEEGETRVKEIYAISAPIAGHLDRTSLEEGEAVKANETVIAMIHPLDPPFLDNRTMAELRAAVEAAKSAIALAEVELTQAQVAYELARSEQSRAARLMTSNVISTAQMERANNDLKLKAAQVKSAEALVSLRHAELDSVMARFTQPGRTSREAENDECCIEITSPIDGIVLNVLARSEQAIAPGTKIAEIGDPGNLEVVVDLLSTDAPSIEIGTSVEIAGWGGDKTLNGTVTRIDPTAFTKVSSLGIEEQRVNAVIDLANVPPGLGHGYRVLAKLQVWEQNNALQVPIGALFRSGGEWAVFVLEDGRASVRPIGIGKMNDRTAQIIDGLSPGDAVILYPSDLLEDGTPAEPRR